MEPIKHLQNQQTFCQMKTEKFFDYNIKFYERIFNSRILKTPSTDIREGKHLNYFYLTTYICNGSLGYCERIVYNETLEAEVPALPELVHCETMLIQFHHNFTHLQNGDIFFICNSDNNLEKEFMTLEIEVLFSISQANHHNNSYDISGNYGYKTGKPLITTALISINATDLFYLEFFNRTSSHNGTHLLKIPKIQNNICKLNEIDYDTVKFNENYFLKCNVLYDKTENITSLATNNLTSVCWTIQKHLMNYLLNHDKSNENKLYLSKYGNPKNTTNSWTLIQIVDDLKYEDIIGYNSTNRNSFVCQKMIINLRYNFYFAKLVDEKRHQEKHNIIENAEVTFGTRVDLEFDYNDKIKIPIFLQIQFDDLTSTK